jgi:predicted TPR repeat methyltransferase
MGNVSSPYTQYFKNRNVSPEFYGDFQIPCHLENLLPTNKSAEILDVGCGFGQMLLALRNLGYGSLTGIDLSEEAVSFCLAKNLNVKKIQDIKDFCLSHENKRYDFIIASHVLEHLTRSDIIETVKFIKARLLTPDGSFYVAVPNAQSNTGSYWAYEDFTHTTLFTAGSLYFVLKSAGFESVEFLDPDGLECSMPIIKWIKKVLLIAYKTNINFWNLVTNSSFHRPSPQIFTFELKAIAK